MASKMTTYSTIIKQWLDEFATRMNGGRNLDYESITDDVHHHYEVIRTSWHKDVFEYNVVFHFQINRRVKFGCWLITPTF